MADQRSSGSNKEEHGQLLSKRVKVCVCTNSSPGSVQGLIDKLKSWTDVVKEVHFETLPYNVRDMMCFDLREIDVLILCHSIDNRRFSITDVTDSLYDQFLPHVKLHLGISKCGVIAHDFPSGELAPEQTLEARMLAFRRRQPTTFENTSLALVGGKLSERPIELTSSQTQQLNDFLKKAASPPCWETTKVRVFSFVSLFCCNNG